MSDEILWNEIGNIYLKFGSPRDAIVAFTKAVEINPGSGWGYSSLGNAYLLTGEFGHALFLFRKSLQLMETPENQAAVWNKIGDTYRALKDMDNAIQAYKKADALDMGTSTSEQKNIKESSDIPGFHELIKSEKEDPNSVTVQPDFEKTAPHTEQTIENQVFEDGFQPVIDASEFVNEFPKSDSTDTKPIFLPKPNMADDQISDLTTNNTRQIIYQQDKLVEDLPSHREKPLIVIPEPTGIVDTTSKDGSHHSEPPQIK